jgi:hypothetical protein
MEPATVPFVQGADDLTVDWCNAALGPSLAGGRVVAVTTEPVGTGQVADTVRLQLTYDDAGTAGPATLVAKVPAADETSRAGARFSRTYEIEASFYRDLAPVLPVRTPNCHHASHDPETDGYVVLLEDVAPARQGDQMDGCPVPDIAAAIDELVLLQGPRWGDEALLEIPWLHRSSPEALDGMVALVTHAVGPFKEHYTDRLDADTLALVDRLVPRLDGYLRARPRPWTIVHGDFRADNLLFGSDRVVVVDWQTVGLGPGPSDVSYLLGASLRPEDRRQHEGALVDRYVHGLVGQGVDVDRDDVWEQYRRYSFGGLIMAIVASFLVQRTDRGDDMFITMAERHARQALDLDAESLITASP